MGRQWKPPTLGDHAPSAILHAGLTWNPSQTSYTPLPSILDRHLFQDASGQLSRTLISLGNTDSVLERASYQL